MNTLWDTPFKIKQYISTNSSLEQSQKFILIYINNIFIRSLTVTGMKQVGQEGFALTILTIAVLF